MKYLEVVKDQRRRFTKIKITHANPAKSREEHEKLSETHIESSPQTHRSRGPLEFIALYQDMGDGGITSSRDTEIIYKQHAPTFEKIIPDRCALVTRWHPSVILPSFCPHQHQIAQISIRYTRQQIEIQFARTQNVSSPSLKRCTIMPLSYDYERRL